MTTFRTSFPVDYLRVDIFEGTPMARRLRWIIELCWIIELKELSSGFRDRRGDSVALQNISARVFGLERLPSVYPTREAIKRH